MKNTVTEELAYEPPTGDEVDEMTRLHLVEEEAELIELGRIETWIVAH
jgi:hypothetical protein